MQFYQLLADYAAGFFVVWAIFIYRRGRDGYNLCGLQALTSMMDMSLLAAWFFAAFLPSVGDGPVAGAL